MQLEFHQLERQWEHLRVRHAGRQRRLLASLAEVGQQTPIVVVAAEGPADRYVVINGYKRIAALEQLSRNSLTASSTEYWLVVTRSMLTELQLSSRSSTLIWALDASVPSRFPI